jgi:hypothetical protein
LFIFLDLDSVFYSEDEQSYYIDDDDDDGSDEGYTES